MDADRPIRVAYFTDILCIWAYVAQVRIDELLRNFPGQVELNYLFVPVFGDVPAFEVPEYTLNSLWEFPLYVVLGVVAAGIAVLYTRTLYASEDLFDGWKFLPEWSKAAGGGRLLGCVALAYGAIPGLGIPGVGQGVPLRLRALEIAGGAA